MSNNNKLEVPHLIYTSANTQTKAGQQITSISPSRINDQIRIKILDYSFGVNPYRSVLCRIDVTDTLYCYQLNENEIAIGRLIDAGCNYDGRPGRTQTHTIILTENEFEMIDFNPFYLYLTNVFTQNDFADSDFTIIDLMKIMTQKAIIENDLHFIKQRFSMRLVNKIITGILLGKNIVILFNDIQPFSEIQVLFKLIPKSVRSLIRLATFFYDPFLQTNPYNTLSKSDFNLIFAPRSCVKSVRILTNTMILDHNGNKVAGEEDVILNNHLANIIIKYIENYALKDLLTFNDSIDKMTLKYRNILSKEQFRNKISDLAKSLESKQIIERLQLETNTSPNIQKYSDIFKELSNYKEIIIANQLDNEIDWFNSSYQETLFSALSFDTNHFINELPYYIDFLITSPFGISLESDQIREKLIYISKVKSFEEEEYLLKLLNIFLDHVIQNKLDDSNNEYILNDYIFDKLSKIGYNSIILNKIEIYLRSKTSLELFDKYIDISLKISSDFSLSKKQIESLLQIATSKIEYKGKQIEIIAKALSRIYDFRIPDDELYKFTQELFNKFYSLILDSQHNETAELKSLFNKIENNKTRIKNNIIKYIKEILYPNAIKSPNNLLKIINLIYAFTSISEDNYETLSLYFLALKGSLLYDKVLSNIENHNVFLLKHLDRSTIELVLSECKEIFINQNVDLKKFYAKLLFNIHNKFEQELQLISVIDMDLVTILNSLLLDIKKNDNFNLINPILDITPKTKQFEKILTNIKIILITKPIKQGLEKTFYKEITEFIDKETDINYLYDAWLEIKSLFELEQKSEIINWLITDDWLNLVSLFYNKLKEHNDILYDYKLLLCNKNYSLLTIYNLFKKLEFNFNEKGRFIFNELIDEIFWSLINKNLDSKDKKSFNEIIQRVINNSLKDDSSFQRFIKKMAAFNKLNKYELENFLIIHYYIYKYIIENNLSDRIIKIESFINLVFDFLVNNNKSLLDFYGNEKLAILLNSIIIQTLKNMEKESQNNIKYNTKRETLIINLFSLFSNNKSEKVNSSKNIDNLYRKLIDSINQSKFQEKYSEDILKLLDKTNKNNNKLADVFYESTLELNNAKALNLEFYEKILELYLKYSKRSSFDNYKFSYALSSNIRNLYYEHKINIEKYLIYMKNFSEIFNTKNCPNKIKGDFSVILIDELIKFLKNDNLPINIKKIAEDLRKNISKYLP